MPKTREYVLIMRRRSGLSQAETALRIGTTVNTYSRFERGYSTFHDLLTWGKLADALNTSIDDLYSYETGERTIAS